MLLRLLRYLRDRFERLTLGAVGYYRRRGARIGNVALFAWPSMAEPHLCEVGDNAWITSGVLFLNHDGSVAMLNRAGRTSLVNVVGRIVVRENTFIGTRSILMPDIVIGPNSVVAAGSVVTKDVPPGMVVGGCPAKVICTTEQLLMKYEGEDRVLYAENESRIQQTVTEFFMTQNRRGKYGIRLRQGKTQLTR